MDGSFLDDNVDLWQGGAFLGAEPNAGGNADGAAELCGILGFGNRLADYVCASDTKIFGAIYKCCYEEQLNCKMNTMI